MIRKLFQTGCAVFALGMTGSGLLHAAELREVRVAADSTSTRVALQLSGDVGHKYFSLEKPDRLVIDLLDTHEAPRLRLPPGIGLVDTIRTGKQAQGTLRLVFELKARVPAEVEWAQSSGEPGKQLIIELGAAVPRSASIGKGAASSAGSAWKSGEGAEAGGVYGASAGQSGGTQAAGPRAAQVGQGANTGSAAKAATAGAAASRVASAGSEVESDVENDAPARGVSPPRPILAQHAPTESNRDVVIAIDAGHGGKDPGSIGRDGTYEKSVVFAVARLLADRINSEPGMRAVLTRDRDEFVIHRERIRRARAQRADLFVSVHADSIRDRSITGASVYVLSQGGASSEAARWLAERENAADLMGGVSLSDKDRALSSVLMDLSMTANINTSASVAERVLLSLDRVGEVRKPKVQQAGFLVLKSPDIPSILVETAYISNPSEELRLRTPSHQNKLANAIFQGLYKYFEQYPPAGTRFAQGRRSTVAGVMAGPSTP